MKAAVECLSSSSYEQRPVALTWQGQRLEIEQVLSEWRLPGGHRFRVRTRDLRLFELTWDEPGQDWKIQPL